MYHDPMDHSHRDKQQLQLEVLSPIADNWDADGSAQR